MPAGQEATQVSPLMMLLAPQLAQTFEGDGPTAYDSAGSNDGTIYGAKYKDYLPISFKDIQQFENSDAGINKIFCNMAGLKCNEIISEFSVAVE